MKKVTITKDTVKKYDTNDIIHFVAINYSKYLKQLADGISANNVGVIGASWANLMHITDILVELDNKVNDKSDMNVL